MLAEELLELLDPQPGQTAIDCTFGDGGHARMVAERLGSGGTLIAIDRDPLAEQRFAALAAEAACSVRFIRSGYAEALEQLAAEGLRADMAYFDLGMSSMQVDTRERGFSYSYEAPLDMRMDPEPGVQRSRAGGRVGRAAHRPRAARLRRGAPRRRDRPGDRRTRAQQPIETTLQLVDAINSAIPAPARFAGGHPAKRSFQALRIAVNDELGSARARAAPGLGPAARGRHTGRHLLPLAGGPPRQAFLGERAQGCICPPDLPVCVCGREPEAALIARRSIVPSAAEVAANPRAASGRLRVARKLVDEAR